MPVNRERIEGLFERGEDIYSSANSRWEYVPIDDTFPQYVIDHQDELTSKGFIKLVPTNVVQFEKPRSLIGILHPTVTACISSKDRYFTTLPTCIAAIATQTRKPEKLVIYDDGEQLDLRNVEPYEAIFRMLDEVGIKWEVVATPRKGQVTNHQHCLDTADTDYIWRVDDDLVPLPDCLERLLNTIRDYRPHRNFSEHSIGAVAGLIHHPHNVRPLPDSVTGKLSDVSLGLNMQWFSMGLGVREVSHLYSSFLYRTSAAREAGGYPINLSEGVGHREETIFTHQIFRAGYKLLVAPDAKSYHLQAATGGIRAHSAHPEYWEHDEAVFQEYLRVWGVDLHETKLITLDSGAGDHFCFKAVLPQVRMANRDRKIVLATCYPQVFSDVKDIEQISIADAKLLMGSKLDDHNVYRFMEEHNWKGSLTEAYLEMFA